MAKGPALHHCRYRGGYFLRHLQDASQSVCDNVPRLFIKKENGFLYIYLIRAVIGDVLAVQPG